MDFDRKQRLAEIDSAIERGEVPAPITIRDLLGWYGVQRRGTNVIEIVRAELLSFGLSTEPDFASAWLDQSISFVRASDGEGPPPPGWARNFQRIAAQLDRGEIPESVTIRNLLRWFGAERRGSYIVHRIEDALSEFGLQTEPDFRNAYIDAEIVFRRALNFSEADELPPQLVPETSPGIAVESSPISEVGETSRSARESAVEKQSMSGVGGTEFFAQESVLQTDNENDDPTFRIGTLKTANLKTVGKELTRISPNTTIMQAVTTMMSHDISHLPVMQNDRGAVKGVVTWQAIGLYLSVKRGDPSDDVRKCMTPPREVSAKASLFAVIPDIVEHGYVLIRDAENRITGIVTTNDLGFEFREAAEPFLLLGEIENYVRILVDRGKFTSKELDSSKNPEDSRAVQSVHDLTLGDLLRILQDPSKWNRIDLAIDRKGFAEDLEKIRVIRNDVMHFRPDPLPKEKLETLQCFARFMRELRHIGAI